MPQAIRKIGTAIPVKVSKLYEEYPFEEYGMPYIKRKLIKYGITQNKLPFDECVEISMIGYMYSIHRCAYMNYDYVENYIKHMISCCIKIGLVLTNKDRYSLQSGNYRIVYLDDERNSKKI